MTARESLDEVARRFGPSATEWIAEVRGSGGQPQPLHWEILSFSRNSPGLLHRFIVSPGRAEDAGPETRRYPTDAPAGFFTLADLGLDSAAAFTIAEAEARKAMIGFDSCDYFLHSREFGRETIWRLELVDASHRLVGQVFISGSNGQVLRTIWVQRDTISGYPRYLDSLSPTSGPGDFTGGEPPRNPIPLDGRTMGRTPREVAPANRGVPYPYRPQNNPQSPSLSGPPATGNVPSGQSGIFRSPSSPGEATARPITPKMPTDPRLLSVPEPEPSPLPEPKPEPAAPAPPIQVPEGAGSTERIPPPPVPR